MRVIAGTARSVPLVAPRGLDTRPTTDRIKETLFNILQNEVNGAVFFDVFAAISIPFNCCGGNLKWVFTAFMNILSNAIICDYKFFFQIFNNEKIKKTLPINIVKIQCL